MSVFLFTILIELLLLCIYSLFRNEWVSKIQLYFNHFVYLYQIQNVQNNSNTYTECIDSIYSYNKMFYHKPFCFDLDQMIENRELYNKIIDLKN